MTIDFASDAVRVASPSAWNSSLPALEALGAQLAAAAAVQADTRVAAVGASSALVYGAALLPGTLPPGLANAANPAAGGGLPAPRNSSAVDAVLLDMVSSRAAAAQVAGFPSAYAPAAAAARCTLRGAGGSAGLFEFGGWNQPFGFITGGARLLNVTPAAAGGNASSSYWAADVAGARGGFAHAGGARAAAAAACAGAGTVYVFGGLQQAAGGGGAGGALRPSADLLKLEVAPSGEKPPASAAAALDAAAAGEGAPASDAAPSCATSATLLVLPSSSQLLWVHVVEPSTGRVRLAGALPRRALLRPAPGACHLHQPRGPAPKPPALYPQPAPASTLHLPPPKVHFHEEGLLVSALSPYMATFDLPPGNYSVYVSVGGGVQLLYADGSKAATRGMFTSDAAASGLVDAAGAPVKPSTASAVVDWQPCREAGAAASGALPKALYSAQSALLAPAGDARPSARHGCAAPPPGSLPTRPPCPAAAARPAPAPPRRRAKPSPTPHPPPRAARRWRSWTRATGPSPPTRPACCCCLAAPAPPRPSPAPAPTPRSSPTCGSTTWRPTPGRSCCPAASSRRRWPTRRPRWWRARSCSGAASPPSAACPTSGCWSCWRRAPAGAACRSWE
jgi:hypothetical protein